MKGPTTHRESSVNENIRFICHVSVDVIERLSVEDTQKKLPGNPGSYGNVCHV